jgi:hypothetical protein
MDKATNKSVFLCELAGMVFIIFLGSALHFTFELSGDQPIVGAFSAVNESVWEHLKLAFWPAIFFTLIEYKYLRKSTDNFIFAKTVGIYLMPIAITIFFYSYTAILGEDLFVMDILTFILAVIIGQLASYKLLTYKKLQGYWNNVSLVALIILGIAFVLFTYYPLQLPIFRDPVTGSYGISG